MRDTTQCRKCLPSVKVAILRLDDGVGHGNEMQRPIEGLNAERREGYWAVDS